MTNTKEFMMTEGTELDFEQLSAVSGGISDDTRKLVKGAVEYAKELGEGIVTIFEHPKSIFAAIESWF